MRSLHRLNVLMAKSRLLELEITRGFSPAFTASKTDECRIRLPNLNAPLRRRNGLWWIKTFRVDFVCQHKSAASLWGVRAL